MHLNERLGGSRLWCIRSQGSFVDPKNFQQTPIDELIEILGDKEDKVVFKPSLGG